jgi:hypothetical protein
MNIFFSRIVFASTHFRKVLSKFLAIFLTVQMILMPAAPALAEVVTEDAPPVVDTVENNIDQPTVDEPVDQAVTPDTGVLTPADPPPIDTTTDTNASGTGSTSVDPVDLGLTPEDMKLIDEGTLHSHDPKLGATPSGLAFSFKVADTTIEGKREGAPIGKRDVFEQLLKITTTAREVTNFSTTQIGSELLGADVAVTETGFGTSTQSSTDTPPTTTSP